MPSAMFFLTFFLTRTLAFAMLYCSLPMNLTYINYLLSLKLYFACLMALTGPLRVRALVLVR